MTHPEDLPDPGNYVDPETGDIWEKLFSGEWRVNGMVHKPFPYALVPEQDNPIAVEWRVIPGFSKYEANQMGTVRFVEDKTELAPSMQDLVDSYFPLMSDVFTLCLVPLERILETTFPEEKRN